MIWNITPEFAIWNPYTPPSRQNRVTIPPTAGALASAPITCPSAMPPAANGTSPTSSRPATISHSRAESRTPSAVPARHSSAIVSSALR